MSTTCDIISIILQKIPILARTTHTEIVTNIFKHNKTLTDDALIYLSRSATISADRHRRADYENPHSECKYWADRIASHSIRAIRSNQSDALEQIEYIEWCLDQIHNILRS